MRPYRLARKLHYWCSFAIAVPLLCVIATGILLQLKKHWSFVQPPEQRGSVNEPQIPFAALLAAAQTVPGLQVPGWRAVERIDVRPAKGLAKLTLTGGHEVQVDIGTGAVLQSARRRSDLIESIHDGSFFAGEWTRLGVFLPVGVMLLLMLGSGLWMWWYPIAARRRARVAIAAHRDRSRSISAR